MPMNRITIIGSGFAALTAVRSLRKKDRTVEITVISPKAEFVYTPSLIWVPTELREGPELVTPLANFFKRMNVRHVAAAATGLAQDGRIVQTDQGDVENDGLIIAAGARFIKKLPGIEHALTICEGVEPARKMRDRIAEMAGGSIAVGFGGNPNEKQAVRGGPMFELLFGLDAYLRRIGKRDRIKLKFFSPAPKPGIRLGEKAYNGLIKRMEKKNIKIASLGAKMKAFEADRVITENGEFEASLNLFMPGLTGPAWLDNTELPRSPGGMIAATPHCAVEGFERVYVAGDIGSFAGPDWAPKQAHMADLQAEAAAANLLAEMEGRAERRGFKWELICIVDTLDKGILVFRNEKRRIVGPPTKIMHWSKRAFEKKYMKQYR